MLPSSLGVPYLHHQHHECIPGNLICHQKNLHGEQIAKLSKLSLSDSDSGTSIQTRVEERSVNIIGYEFESNQFIIRENTLVYIKKFPPRPHNKISKHKLEKALKAHTSKLVTEKTQPDHHQSKEVRGPYYDYQAFFYWVNHHRQVQPITFLLKRKGKEKPGPVYVMGKYSFYLHRHMVPSPIKELLEFIKNHIITTIDPVVNQTLPSLQILEVTDGFVSRTVGNQSSIVVELPPHFHSLIRGN
jgi:hypothetical protein